MDYLLVEFCEQIHFHTYIEYYNLPEGVEILDYERDDSNYHIIDNEEADYGEIKYFHAGKLIAIYYNYGGDSYDVTFTQYGKEHFQPMVEILLKRELANMLLQ